MADYGWPPPEDRRLIGKRTSRVDAPFKVSGRAQYNSDYRPAGMLFGKILRSPHAKAEIISIDVSAAGKMPGVKAIEIIQPPGSIVHWAGDEIAGVAATSEGAAEDAILSIKVIYKPLPHFVSDAEPAANAGLESGPLSPDDIEDAISDQIPDDQVIAMLRQRGVSFKVDESYLEQMIAGQLASAVIEAIRDAPERPAVRPQRRFQRSAAITHGDPSKAFLEAEVVCEGIYGLPVITHCCLEAHGSTVEWTSPESLLVHISTQNVSGIAGQMAEPLGVQAANIRVQQQNVGGGFGSKFTADRWDITAAKLSRKAGGRPVRMFLERSAELEVAGARPSAYAGVRVAAKADGTLTGWESSSWGTAGPGGGGMPPIPYLFSIPNQRKEHTAIQTNMGPARAWRAPGHSQAALITMAALEDTAAKLNLDPLELVRANLKLTAREQTYAEEFAVASELMGWKQKWRPRGTNVSQGIGRGLGLSLHTGGGRGHASDCDLTIHPDGSVTVKLGSQDIGTGTRTAILVVTAETLGLPIDAINLHLGDTQYSPSGGSGGSTTIGGVSAATRRAAVDARDVLFEKVAPVLNAQANELEAVEGTVRVRGDGSRGLSWREACARLGAMPLTVRGRNSGFLTASDLTNSGVGGVQMAEVEVDIETGVVRVLKMVAVQDCGLIVDLKTAESQCYGAVIMGISYALFEEKVMDSITGRMLNPNLEAYRLAGYGDIPEIVVHLMTGKGYDERGVIGLGEPPVISPGAAISNAVANAIGVRVPFLPLTPDRVLDALAQEGIA